MTADFEKFLMDFLLLARKKAVNKEPYHYFVSPCQITGIFVKEYNLFFIIAKHDSELKDRTIERYIVDDQKAMKSLLEDTVFLNPYWKKQSQLLMVASLFESFLQGYPIDELVKDDKICDWWDLSTSSGSRKNDGCLVCQINPETETIDDLDEYITIENEKLKAKHPFFFKEYSSEYEYMDVFFGILLYFLRIIR